MTKATIPTTTNTPVSSGLFWRNALGITVAELDGEEAEAGTKAVAVTTAPLEVEVTTTALVDEGVVIVEEGVEDVEETVEETVEDVLELDLS